MLYLLILIMLTNIVTLIIWGLENQITDKLGKPMFDNISIPMSCLCMLFNIYLMFVFF